MVNPPLDLIRIFVLAPLATTSSSDNYHSANHHVPASCLLHTTPRPYSLQFTPERSQPVSPAITTTPLSEPYLLSGHPSSPVSICASTLMSGGSANAEISNSPKFQFLKVLWSTYRNQHQTKTLSNLTYRNFIYSFVISQFFIFKLYNFII